MNILPYRRAAAVLGVVVGATVAGAACSAPHSARNLFIVLPDATASAVGQQDAQLRHLSSVVLPAAATGHARVIVGEVGAAGLTQPILVGNESYAPTSDNPLVNERDNKAVTKRLLAEVATVFTGAPALASDPFGSLAWASTIAAQFPRTHVTVVLLGDAMATMRGCRLDALELTSAAARRQVIASCNPGGVPTFSDAELWGAGTAVGAGISTERAQEVAALYREYGADSGAVVTRWGPTLVSVEASAIPSPTTIKENLR
jgi:hypothetical protein